MSDATRYPEDFQEDDEYINDQVDQQLQAQADLLALLVRAEDLLNQS